MIEDKSASRASRRERVVRVFVSSTFRDMKEERDHLVKFIFPQLRKLCESRGVTWCEVDLRWGITDEQKAEGKVLPICLEEIKRCRPFFIGLLGERYGWVPQEIPQELIEQESWLAEHREKSVTELEIIHGVLNDPAMANRACFYFRNPAYVDKVPADQRADFIEQDPHTRHKLATLKDRIRASGLAVRENYRDPQALGQLVLEDLTAAIKQEFPPETVPNPHDREAAEHEAFAQSRASVYIGRKEYFDCLDSHVAGDGLPLVILGESGAGKSALVVNWTFRYQHEHPDVLVIQHYIGATPYSADWAAMVRRIMGELKRRFGIQQDIPDKPDELRLAFANWLHMAAAKGKVILILDALNQLEDRDGAPDLVWLPPVIPANMRLVVSTLPGRSLDELKKRNWPTLQVNPLQASERKELIKEYLGQYRKTLAPKRVERISGASQTDNSLYLRALLEELRVFGVHERLDERIEHYLAAETIPQLYERILERYEQDYQCDRPNLVKDAMSLIWASRRGLSETELLEMLGKDGKPLPRAYWSGLYLAAEQSLVNRSGLIGFFHEYLREAVRQRYLPSEEQQKAVHLRLADYLADYGIGLRKLDEYPYQLQQAGDWQALAAALTDLDFFEYAWDSGRKCEWLGYWRLLKGRFEPGSCYQAATDARQRVIGPTEKLAQLLSKIGRFLQDMGLYESASRHYRCVLSIRERTLGPEHPDVAAILSNLALLHHEHGYDAEAIPLLERSLAIAERALGPSHPHVATYISQLLEVQTRDVRMDNLSLAQRALLIREQSLGPDHLQVASSLIQLAEIHIMKARSRHLEDELAKAVDFCQRALTIRESALGPHHPDLAPCLILLGESQHVYGDPEGSLRSLQRALVIRERSFGSGHPLVAESLQQLALEYLKTKNYICALPLYKRALVIREKIPSIELIECQIDMAMCYLAQHRYVSAFSLFLRTIIVSNFAYAGTWLLSYRPALFTLLTLSMFFRGIPCLAEHSIGLWTLEGIGCTFVGILMVSRIWNYFLKASAINRSLSRSIYGPVACVVACITIAIFGGYVGAFVLGNNLEAYGIKIGHVTTILLVYYMVKPVISIFRFSFTFGVVVSVMWMSVLLPWLLAFVQTPKQLLYLFVVYCLVRVDGPFTGVRKAAYGKS